MGDSGGYGLTQKKQNRRLRGPIETVCSEFTIMAEKHVKVGLVGFGTVGTGVARIILEDGDAIAERTGVRLELARVVDADTERPRDVSVPQGVLTSDLGALMNDPSISIGVETVGGIETAKRIQMEMLAAGKDVVTANKALLAECGDELYAAARANSRCIAFEASCAGGIPIVSAIRTGLRANRIQAMYGIVNGTCNYILSNMTAKNEDFAEALSQAQAKGYAEADPTLDISGGDSAHKLAILGSIAFGYDVRLEDIFVEGIESVSIDDIRYGAEMGYCLKLLAIAEQRDGGQISLRVHPSFIPDDSALARVEGPFNAISVFGSAVGQVMFYGRGAGMMPTASAIVADIIDVAMGNSRTTFEQLKIRSRGESVGMIQSIDDCVCRFYIRVMVEDRPGVVASYGKALGDHGISISGALQHEGTGPDNSVPVVITTHATQERNMAAAMEDLMKLDVISGRPTVIRIVDIPEDKD